MWRSVLETTGAAEELGVRDVLFKIRKEGLGTWRQRSRC